MPGAPSILKDMAGKWLDANRNLHSSGYAEPLHLPLLRLPPRRFFIEQPRRLDPQRLGNALEHRHRRRILLPLDHADVIAVDADAGRKLFLRQAALLAQTPDVSRNNCAAPAIPKYLVY
jgi:hypothetical protein